MSALKEHPNFRSTASNLSGLFWGTFIEVCLKTEIDHLTNYGQNIMSRRDKNGSSLGGGRLIPCFGDKTLDEGADLNLEE